MEYGPYDESDGVFVIEYDPLDAGLVAYFPFNSNAIDESGNGNDGTVYGAILTEDRFGNANSAYSFDGKDDYVQTPDITTHFDLRKLDSFPWSISFWAKSSVSDQHDLNYPFIFSQSVGYHDAGIRVGNTSVNYTLYEVYEGGGEVPVGYTFPEGFDYQQWHHYVFAKDENSVVKIYVDGKFKTSGIPTKNVNNSINTLRIGGQYTNVERFWNGHIDEVRIYNRALSDAEIQELFQTDLNVGLVAHYPLNGNAMDESGNENHGTVYGATLTEDRFGNADGAYSFDGVDDYVETTVIELPINFTICAWISPDSVTDTYHLINKHNGTVQSYYCGFDNGGRLINSVRNTSGSYTQYRTNDVVLSSGRWQFVVLTYDGNAGADQKMKFFVDGLEIPATHISSYDSGGTPETGVLTTKIGTWGTATQNFFDGTMDDIRIYNRVLSEPEIQGLFDQTDLNADLVAHYPLNGNAMDESGNENHGIVYGATLTEDRFGNADGAYSFDGVDDYIDAGNAQSIGLTGPLTIAAWVNLDIPSSGMDPDPAIVQKTGEWGSGDLGWILRATRSGAWLWNFGSSSDGNNGSWRIINSNTALPISGSTGWTHVAVVADTVNSSYYFYVNGQLDSTAPGSSTIHNSSSNLCIGGGSPGLYLSGIVDDIRIYNRAFSESEIQELFNQTDLNASLVAYYPLNGNAMDESGNGNHGTAYGEIEYLQGKVGQAACFDGVDDYVKVPHSESVNFDKTNAFSIAAWVNLTPRGDENAQQIVGKRGPGGQGYNLKINYDGTIEGGFYDGSTFRRVRAGNYPYGEWCFITLTHDGSTIRGYMDGILIDSDSTSLAGNVTNTDDLSIGRYSGNIDAEQAIGQIDEVAIYKRALSESEIKELYSVTIVEGNYTKSSEIHLSLCSQDATEMMISEDAEFSNAT